MKASLGTYGIQQLSQKLRGEQETVKRQKDGQSGYEEEEVLKQYEESKQPEEGTEKQKVKENLERHAFGTGSEAAGTGRFCESD